MMGKGKLVHLVAHEPVGLSGRHQQAWSDTYVKTSLGKKRWLRLGPMIAGTEDLRHELAFERDFAKKYPEYDEGEVQHLEAAKAATDRGEIYFEPGDADRMPELYVPAPMVNRCLIERAVAAYLAERHGFRRCRFKWRRPKAICGPVTIPVADIRTAEESA